MVLEEQLREVYRQAKKALQIAIRSSKEQAREELLEGLNRDPWGRPYRVARGKLRNQGPPVTQTLQPEFLRRVVDELFPDSRGHIPPTMSSSVTIEDNGYVPLVTEEEIDVALERLQSKKTAPGPDGIPGRVIFITREFLEGRLRELFNQCLRTGQFPESWKEGLLCLIRKEGRPLETPAAYRPIVLLNEVGKLFEILPRMRVFCYADDTLVTARGSNYGEASLLATVATSLVVRRIQMLGLRVSASKTEALLFHGPRRGPPQGAYIRVQDERVELKAHMKYLGLILDGRWTFHRHFELLGPRLVGAAATLGRLLPNVGGPASACRRLFMGIVRSMALV
ncbi:uncharacterized protein LOC128199182 [Bicyclus anynana]|uniref:Uncharacterized protein LOC128199182 n=1 Tax=Bicyclus anynana TaxID=110368 RepID=A0ABM3LWU7_BICAN|nr:uncharacterized protein LOC128199182 [Bicyclus anynana]